MKRFMMLCMLTVSMAFMTACGSTTDTNTAKTESAEQLPEETFENGLPASKQPDPNAPDLDSVIIYAPDESGEVSGQMDAVDELSEQALLDKLVEYGVLAPGVKLEGFELTEADAGAAGPGVAGPGAAAGPGVSGTETEAAGPGAAETAAQSGTLTLSGVAAGESGISEEDARAAVEQTFQENYSLVDVTLVEN